jgi:hypothetical protein
MTSKEEIDQKVLAAAVIFAFALPFLVLFMVMDIAPEKTPQHATPQAEERNKKDEVILLRNQPLSWPRELGPIMEFD